MENIGAIITAYRKKAHISQTELAEKLLEEGIEVSQKSVSAWETGRNEVSARIFLHICRILEIPDCLEEYFGSNPKDPLALLNDEGKQKALSYIDLLIHPVSYVKETNVIPYPAVPADEPAMARIRLYDARVSAGHGDFLDSDYYTTIEVPARDAKGANFAVTISGDSMEPAFHDHDMVYVHQQETLDDGEIGIFSLNDNAYIKKLKNDSDGTFLISLNQKYAPIPVHLDRDDFRIFGKVCRATR
ncbi:S24 family peptidase [Porcincola sp. LCP21S3_C12]|uniref:S24 family peptidase n=1 Tax=Porcincola sp. LCP21S3_C12 TaxID=3438798 RepID=UPI003F9A85FF